MKDATVPRSVKALALVSFLTDAASEMIYPLLPTFLSATLGVGAAWVGVIEGAADMTAAFVKLASGWWSDRLARRKPLVVAGYGIASAMRPLIGLASAGWQVLAIRMADRVGKGIRGAPRDALIADAVPAERRARAFGVQRAADHAGAFVGPLIAFALLQGMGLSLRTLFLLAAVPGALAVVAAVVGVRETPRAPRAATTAASGESGAFGAPFWRYLAVLVLFTLGNSTDAFLLLRASQLGVPTAMLPLLWAALHVVKSSTSVPSGVWADRIGHRRVIAFGWLWYALVYVGFAMAHEAWQAWALFLAYGLFFGLTEGVERALVAELVPAERRGAAYGWYNGAIGAAILPASVIFGLLWDWRGSAVAFGVGAACALAAALALLLEPSRRVSATPSR